MENKDNNIGKWDSWYKNLTLNDRPHAYRYGDTETYQIAADFLSDCETVEDWGVGAGGFLNYRTNAIGVDGSDTPFAEKKNVDLCNYVSDCEGVHMRHVLEHNYEWYKILENSLKTASKKVCITFFIPLNEGETIELAHNLPHGVDVPDLSISRDKFDAIVAEYDPKSIEVDVLDTKTGYNIEIVCKITK